MDRPFPAYSGDEDYVFVSYSHNDNALVYPEIAWMNLRGFNIWYDEGINPGASWRNEVADAIERSKLFIYFVTPRSATSVQCQKEVNFAIDHNIPLVAIHLEESTLVSGLELTLSDIQAIHRFDLSHTDYEKKVVAGISRHLDSSAPTQIKDQPATSRISTPVLAVGAALVLVVAAGIIYVVDRALPYIQ